MNRSREGEGRESPRFRLVRIKIDKAIGAHENGVHTLGTRYFCRHRVYLSHDELSDNAHLSSLLNTYFIIKRRETWAMRGMSNIKGIVTRSGVS